MRKILLNKSRSKTSVNETNVIPVEFNRDTSCFYNEHFLETIDTMEVYNDEKDNCTNHRIICTVSPICSNVLFNNITEVIYKEGSNDCKVLTNNSNNGISLRGTISQQSLNRIHAIRNTEYSHEKFDMTYHCGSDIFNNHILRAKENVIIQKRTKSETYTQYGDVSTTSGSEDNSGSASAVSAIGDWDYMTTDTLETSEVDSFNTIGDYKRDNNGKYIISYFPNASKGYTYNSKISGYTPVYNYDTVKSFNEAFTDGIRRHDGWVGFNNRTTFHIPVSGTNSDGYYVNKCMNNYEGCEYVDLCPSRDLFSLTPKKNPHRGRLEYNWHYTLTYPSKSLYEGYNVLNGKGKGLPLTTFSLLGTKPLLYKNYLNTNGIKMLTLCSVVKHNLKIGDNVAILLNDENNEEYRYKCEIKKLGTSDGKHKERCFVIYQEDIDFEILKKCKSARFIKLVGGFECDYYFRVFSKFKENFKSSVNKLAFATNAYGDEVSQIIFTDDVNVEGYTNNLGQPLTEIYLTLIKNNKGYKQWYEEKTYNNENVEYSHVFGKITSGLDLPSYISYEYPVVRGQHNITNIPNTIHINDSSSVMENDITKDKGCGFNEFLGDLVEFNPMTVKETVLETVKHRFNTAQRETTNKDYGTIFYDEIYSDQTDGENYGKSNKMSKNHIITWKLNEGFANLNPEGYIYTPHHRIKIGEISDTVQQKSDMLIKCQDWSFTTITGSDAFVFTTEQNYGLIPRMIIGILDYNDYTLYKFSVEKYELQDGKYYCTTRPINKESYGQISGSSNIEVFKHNEDIPEYAYMLPDGSGRHIWRDMVKPSKITFTSDMYNTVFTNGAFYHQENILLPVRRQDPFGEFRNFVYASDGVTKIKNNFTVSSKELDITFDEYVNEMEGGLCF